MKAVKQICLAAFAACVYAVGTSAAAGPLPVLTGTYPTPNAACATFGNFVSCSTKVLDYLASTNTDGFTGSYSPPMNQGAVIDTIALATNGGNPAENSDLASPSEDAFRSGTQDFFYTGQPTKQDPTNDPANNGTLLGDTPYSWDIGLGTLNDKLTIDGKYHQMTVAFNFNNPQNATASLPIWALIAIRDLEGILDTVYFETQALDLDNIFADPSLYQSNKTFDGTAVTTPSSGDFAQTIGAICVIDATNSYPSPDGSSCPANMGGGQLVTTNQSSSKINFINYIPSLDLRYLQNLGYDTMSVQAWMGCFNPTNGSPALGDNGSVGPCDTGGYGDVVLMAGAVLPDNDVPEPGTLALFGLGLLGAAAARRRFQS